MSELEMPAAETVYSRAGNVVWFNQLAVKIEMDTVSNEQYFAWLDRMKARIGQSVPGAEIAEKVTARTSPPLNTAVYYDTDDYRILPRGCLLRTSCNKITHAFCAYKGAEDNHGVRADHRYVFDGNEKRTIQQTPASEEAIAIVARLLARDDIEHPGTFLRREQAIDPTTLRPAVLLDDYRFTFFVWLDGKDALRCSIDRATVINLRLPQAERERRPVSEVELAIYPRISAEVAADKRAVKLIEALRNELCGEFGVAVTKNIKYQRAARALGISA